MLYACLWKNFLMFLHKSDWQGETLFPFQRHGKKTQTFVLLSPLDCKVQYVGLDQSSVTGVKGSECSSFSFNWLERT